MYPNSDIRALWKGDTVDPEVKRRTRAFNEYLKNEHGTEDRRTDSDGEKVRAA